MSRSKMHRILSLVLALVMVAAMFPERVVSAGTESRVSTPSGPDYGAVIGNTARLNTKDWRQWCVSTEPPDSSQRDGSAQEAQTCRDWDSNKNPYDAMELIITDYCHDPLSGWLWYKVKGAPGTHIPAWLKQNPWILYDDASGRPGSLIISAGGKNYVLDGEGRPVTCISLTQSEKVSLLGETSLQGSADYRWQILAGDTWVDICGEDSREITVTPGMVAAVCDHKQQARLRLFACSATKTVAGEEIIVSIAPDTGADIPAAQAVSCTALSTQKWIAGAKVLVTVNFVYGSDGQFVSAPRIYEVQKGGSVTDHILLPEMEGFHAYLGDDTETVCTEYDLNLENVTEDRTITFRYWPAKVNYTVIHYWQNAEDDDYTEHHRYTATGFTGSPAEVKETLYDGFYPLIYESVPIASDGSTVIKVYYDRLYYVMKFNLDGGYGVQPIHARYGTQIHISSPVKAGYSFVGWDDITSGAGDGIMDPLPAALPLGGGIYKAIWKADENVKATIVYWGENPDDEEYSYIKSQEIYVKPGTQLTFGSDQLICSLEEHIHDANCVCKCGKAAHTHIFPECYELTCTQSSHIHSECGCTLSCGHTHTLQCYSTGLFSPLQETAKPDQVLQYDGDGIYSYTEQHGTEKHYYLNIGDKWYCAHSFLAHQPNSTEKIRLTCGHSHTDACYTCGQKESTHVHSLAGGCYRIKCPLEAHTHTAACYDCVEHIHNDSCYLRTNAMDPKLWQYVTSDEVTAAVDGSTVMNVYYDRRSFTLTLHYDYVAGAYRKVETITDKWGAEIGDRVLRISSNAKGNLWSTNENGTSPWTSYLQIMPQGSADYYCKKTGDTPKSAGYYTQQTDGSYALRFTVEAYADGYLMVSKEDFYRMDGFVYDHGTDGDGGSMPSPGSYGRFDGAKFYYALRGYNLVFNDGYADVKTESVPYKASLGVYEGFVPEVPSAYEPGSVEFGGWYLNPECTGGEYVLSRHSMPPSNLILYAKWVPTKHTVRFYTEMNLVGTDSTYGDAYIIPHGKKIQNPYTPPRDPEKGKYKFEGWFYTDAGGAERYWDFAESVVVRDVDLYAKWSSNVLMPYTIRYVYVDETGREIEIADRTTGSTFGGNSKTFRAKANKQLYAEYASGYYAVVRSHTITVDLEDVSKNQFTFYYVKRDRVPYTVYYLDAATGKNMVRTDGTEVLPAEHPQNNKAMVTETYLPIPGYLPDAYQKTLVVDPNGENQIIFYYTKDDRNGMYLVHYWTENLQGEYEEYAVFQGRGDKNSTVGAVVRNIENFTYNGEDTRNVLSGTISSDSVLELHIYYTRNRYSYKVQYLEQDSNRPIAGAKLVTGSMWDAVVTESAIPVACYSPVGKTEKSLLIQKDGENPAVNIITFYYIQDKATIRYEVAGGIGGTVSSGSEQVKVLSGKARGSVAAADPGYYFAGWYSDEACTKPVSSDAGYVPVKAEGTKWIDGTTYYAKFEKGSASLTVRKSGAQSVDENQAFMFRIQGEGTDLVVTVHGNDSVTVSGLKNGGVYTVTELTRWSWRYEATDILASGSAALESVHITDASAVVRLGDGENVLSFVNERKNPYWLGGDSGKDNDFPGSN